MSTRTRRSATAKMRPVCWKENVWRKESCIRPKYNWKARMHLKHTQRLQKILLSPVFIPIKILPDILKIGQRPVWQNYIWELKENEARSFTVTWNVLDKVSAYKHGANERPMKCNLCLNEKLFILFQDNSALTQRFELLNSYRYAAK